MTFLMMSGMRVWRKSDKQTTITLIVLLIVLLITLLMMTGSAPAQERNPQVARISLLAGEVSHQRTSDAKGDWYDATINLPLEESDRLVTGDKGRVEIQLSGRNLIRLDHNASLGFTRFNGALAQFAQSSGNASYRIDSLDRRQFQVVALEDVAKTEPLTFEIDTPVAAITLLSEGIYRVDVAADGTTVVTVWRGRAEVFREEIGTLKVGDGRRIVISGRDPNEYQSGKAREKDEWDGWNERRDAELDTVANRAVGSGEARPSRNLPPALPGVRELDLYGDWVETPEYGWAWSPRSMPVDWAPYRLGYWRWYGGYGWTWISYEPWGWVPYHYGRWAWRRNRWFWTPGIVFTANWRWSPHLVAFFGWGNRGYNAGYRDGYRDGVRDGYWRGYRDGRGWMGWCPLAPGESVHGYSGTGGSYPGAVDRLKNYEAPGALSGLESRRFIQNRIVVINESLTAPPRGRGKLDPETSGFVRQNEVQPVIVSPAPVRTPLVEREEVRRRIESNPALIVRRPLVASEASAPGSTSGSVGQPVPPRSVERSLIIPAEPTVVAPRSDVQIDRGAPTRSSRIEQGQVVRPDSPSRVERTPVRIPESRPIERPIDQ